MGFLAKVRAPPGAVREWSLQVVVKSHESFAAVSRGDAGERSRRCLRCAARWRGPLPSALPGSVASLVLDTFQVFQISLVNARHPEPSSWSPSKSRQPESIPSTGCTHKSQGCLLLRAPSLLFLVQIQEWTEMKVLDSSWNARDMSSRRWYWCWVLEHEEMRIK